MVLNDGVSNAKHLPQVGQIGFILTHGLSRGIRYLGHRLAVGAHQLHDNVERRQPHIVGEVGANAKA